MASKFILTKKLNNLPKYFIFYISDYIERCGKDRAFERDYRFFVESYVHDSYAAVNNDIFYRNVNVGDAEGKQISWFRSRLV